MVGNQAKGSKVFGDRLKVLREGRDLSQNRLAKAITRRSGVRLPASTVRRIERGEQAPSLDQLGAIAKYFGVDLGWLADVGITDTQEGGRDGED